MAVNRFALAALAGSLLLAAPVSAQSTTGVVSGRVLDSASRQPLAAVTIRIVGSTIGGQTRADGSFSIRGVPAGAQVLRATRIGFGAQSRQVTVPAAGTATVEFALSTQAAVLTEVVVTGYGTQRREAITGSVSQVQADEANVGVITNANQLLQARVPGVEMIANNGEPGAGAQVRIRGGTSISAGNSPLYVVDGVPLEGSSGVAGANIMGVNAALGRDPLNSINPSDIETVTVLKDASATAIYGSRGANGVILITTKKGSRTGGSAMDYDTYVAMARPSSHLNFLNGDEYRTFVQQQIAAKKIAPTQTALLGSANTDWEAALMHTGVSTNHNLAFSGGSAQTQYRASLNYFDQQGVVIDNGLKRYQGRLNGTHSALDGRLNLDLNMTASRVNNRYLAMENGGGFTGGVFTNMAFFNPTQPISRTDSTGTTTYYEIGTGAQDLRNPVALANQIEDVAPENRLLGNLTANLSVIKGLVSTTTLGTDYTNSVRQSYIPRTNPLGAQFNGVARQAERSIQNLTFQQLLTATPTLGGSQELEVVGGYEYSTFDRQGFEALQQGFITDAFTVNNLAAGSTAGGGSPLSYLQQSTLVSFFSRANYGYADKYFLTGVVRRDGSSRLAEGHKWALFPAVSASWRIGNEDFMKGRMFSSLAVRAGWGKQGNQAIEPYATQLLLRANSGASYPFGSGVTTGLQASQVENPNLKWETSEQTNLGLDWGIKNDRITGVFDLYQKTTKDLLLTVPVPQPAVVSTQIQNIGSVRNRGFEGSVDARLYESGAKAVASGLVFTVERNKVVDLGGSQFIPTGNVYGQGQSGRVSQRIIVGQPLGTFWGPKFLFVNSAGKQVFQCVAKSVGCVNGQTFAPTGDDEMIIGNANPKFTLGFRSTANSGGLDASWLWRGEFGRDVFNNTALVYGTKGNGLSNKNFLRSALSDPTAIDEPAIYSSRWIENGRFIRLQNATVGYSFHLPGIGGGRATRVYLSGDNLLLFTPYTGYDPEVFTEAGTAARGIDYLTYPRARTFTTGAHIAF